MTASVFVGTSVDGFIARLNGDFDFLPEGGGEPHGYNEFIASVDSIVIGRKTFEKVLSMETWPYGDKRVLILSCHPLDLSAAVGGIVEQMAGPPAEIVSQLTVRGVHHLYIDGGITIQGFCAQGSFNASLSLVCRCSLEREFRSSAPYRATSGCATWQPGTIRAAWFGVSTRLRHSERHPHPSCKNRRKDGPPRGVFAD